MAWRPLGLRVFCVAGMGPCTLPRGLMYALASLGAPLILRDRRETMCTAKGSAKGSDVCPGIPWGSASFAWQVGNNVHCQGIWYDICPGVPWGFASFAWQGSAAFAWQAWQRTLPRDQMYVLASLRALPLLRGRRGVICTSKGSDVRPCVPWGSVAGMGQCALPRGSDIRPGVPWGSTSFVWQVSDNIHWQGVWSIPWRRLGHRLFCVAGVGQSVLPRGLINALASRGTPPLHVNCQGVRCTPWRPLGLPRFRMAGVRRRTLPRGQMYALASLGALPLLRGRRGTMCTFKGSDVRPCVPWGSVAGMGQCALPRGSDVCPDVPWGSASFTWQAWDNLHCQAVWCTPWRPLGLRLHCQGVGCKTASLGSRPLLRLALTQSRTSLHSTPHHVTSLHPTPVHFTPLTSVTSLTLESLTHTHHTHITHSHSHALTHNNMNMESYTQTHPPLPLHDFTLPLLYDQSNPKACGVNRSFNFPWFLFSALFFIYFYLTFIFYLFI